MERNFHEFKLPPPPADGNGTLVAPPSKPLIFDRVYVRWIPGLAKEPTSTLRVISPGYKYIDISIIFPPTRRQEKQPETTTAANTSRPLVEEPTLVAFSAGTYYRTQDDGIRGHLVDWTTPFEHVSHNFFTLTHHHNGDVLAKGIAERKISGFSAAGEDTHHRYGLDGSTDVTNPDGSKPPPQVDQKIFKQYEELWRPQSTAPPFTNLAIVLLLRGEDGTRPGSSVDMATRNAKGMVVRVGGWCQGIMQTREAVVVERWERGKDARWRRVVRVGWRKGEERERDWQVWGEENVGFDTPGPDGSGSGHGQPSASPASASASPSSSTPTATSKSKKNSKSKLRIPSTSDYDPSLPNIQEHPAEQRAPLHDLPSSSSTNIPIPNPHNTYTNETTSPPPYDPLKSLILPCSVACMDRDESADAGRWQGGRYWKMVLKSEVVVEKTVRVGDAVWVPGWRWEVVERCQW
ncbi:hypothetical protein EX30DRAFT_363370 [Ascodesmis nigricans]|uniref:Protein HRI1 n=1 Tax=Ascodesmis nigricans TaxID=341454 RepID=A0A4S2MZR0_9PEZI|nr:hypothetical protein EX30DRAFT_363370 [Ascodesmis nigricans]